MPVHARARRAALRVRRIRASCRQGVQAHHGDGRLPAPPPPPQGRPRRRLAGAAACASAGLQVAAASHSMLQMLFVAGRAGHGRLRARRQGAAHGHPACKQGAATYKAPISTDDSAAGAAVSVAAAVVPPLAPPAAPATCAACGPTGADRSAAAGTISARTGLPRQARSRRGPPPPPSERGRTRSRYATMGDAAQ